MCIRDRTPPGRRKRGRPPITWIKEIQNILRELETEEDLWMDKHQWKIQFNHFCNLWFRKVSKHCTAGIIIIITISVYHMLTVMTKLRRIR